MLDVIHSFLDDRKELWLKDRVKAAKNEEEVAHLNEQADNRFNLTQWLPDASKRVSQLFMVSHPSKFSHPSAKTSNVISQAKAAQDGYMRSGNVDYPLDVFGNAAVMDVYKFLSLPLSENLTVLDAFEQDNSDLKKLIDQSLLNFQELKAAFLGIKENNATSRTDQLVKQVFFPINDTEYHLLSILTPSGLITRLKQYIDQMRFSEQTKEAKLLRKNNEHSDDGYSDIYELTVLGYGGTQPQNISVQNSLNAGRSYLLPCVPPVFTKRAERLPNLDFFKQCLPFKYFQESFIELHGLMKNKSNNAAIRAEIHNTIQMVIDQVIVKGFQIRASAPNNWSNQQYYSSLPMLQRIWLDNAYIEERKDEVWQAELSLEIAQWFFSTYEKTANKAVETGVDELNAVKQLVNQSLKQAQGFL